MQSSVIVFWASLTECRATTKSESVLLTCHSVVGLCMKYVANRPSPQIPHLFQIKNVLSNGACVWYSHCRITWNTHLIFEYGGPNSGSPSDCSLLLECTLNGNKWRFKSLPPTWKTWVDFLIPAFAPGPVLALKDIWGFSQKFHLSLSSLLFSFPLPLK